MAKAKRSTRKFVAKHLDRTIKQRKIGQAKKRQRERSVPATRPQLDDERDGEVREPKSKKAKTSNTAAVVDNSDAGSDAALDDLDVDDFLVNGLVGDDNDDEDLDDLDDFDADDSDEGPEVLETDADGTVNDRDFEDEVSQGADEEEEDDDDDEARLQADIAEHEADMRALKERDPKFFAQLQQEDPELLQFSADALSQDGGDDQFDDEGEGDMDEDDDEEDGVPKRKKKPSKVKSAQRVTLDQWKAIRAAVLEMKSATALRKAVRLFRLAAHSGDSEDATSKSDTSSARLLNQRVHESVIEFAITQLSTIFTTHLAFNDSDSAKKSHRSITGHPRYPHFAAPLKSFLINFLHLFQSTHDNQMLRLLINTVMSSMTPLFEPHVKLIHKLMKFLLTLWATHEHSTRIDAFLCLRHICLTFPAKLGLLEEACKGIYLTYVKHSKFTNSLTVPVIEFMGNCIVELYSIDPVIAYQHAFVYIRQLAIHLRNALAHGKSQAAKAKESKGGKSKKGKGNDREGGYQLIYNWQFINCLRVWSKVLSSSLASNPVSGSTNIGGSAALRPLIYPFVQVALGVLALQSSSRYHPLRLIVIQFLIKLARSSHVYLPLLPHLLSVFQSVELTRKPKAHSKKVNDLKCVLKVSKNTVTSKAYQEELTSLGIDAIVDYCAVYSYSIAFPELVLPVKRILKKLAKSTKIARLNKSINGLLTKLDTNSEWIAKKRSQTSYSPQDSLTGKLDSLATFRPVVGEESDKLMSPLHRYQASQSANSGGDSGRVSDKRADWAGKSLKSKKDDSDDEDASDEGSDDDDADTDGIDMDDGLDEDPQPSGKGAGAKRPHSKLVATQSKKRGRQSAAGAEDDDDVVTDLALSDDE